MNWKGVEVHKLEKKKKKLERGQLISSHLDRTNLVNEGFIIRGKKTPFSCGTQQVIPSKQDSAILPARVANHSSGFGSFCVLTELATIKNDTKVEQNDARRSNETRRRKVEDKDRSPRGSSLTGPVPNSPVNTKVSPSIIAPGCPSYRS